MVNIYNENRCCDTVIAHPFLASYCPPCCTMNGTSISYLSMVPSEAAGARDTPGLQEFPHLHTCECLHARYAATLLHPNIVSRLACVDTPGLWMRLGAWGSHTARACIFLLSISRSLEINLTKNFE